MAFNGFPTPQLPFNISKEWFELVPQPEPLTRAAKPASQYAQFNPGAILLRERQARALPDGGWARWYGFSNGLVKATVLPDPSAFDTWEQEWWRSGREH